MAEVPSPENIEQPSPEMEHNAEQVDGEAANPEPAPEIAGPDTLEKEPTVENENVVEAAEKETEVA